MWYPYKSEYNTVCGPYPTSYRYCTIGRMVLYNKEQGMMRSEGWYGDMVNRERTVLSAVIQWSYRNCSQDTVVPFDIEIRCVSVEPQFLKPYLVVEPTYLNFLVAKNKININTMIDSFYCTVHTIVADFTTVASKSCFWKDEDHRKKKEEKESIVNELKLYSITGITGITMPQQ